MFAPVAASIAKNQREFYGASTKLVGRLPWDTTGHHVVHVDAYGNLITNLRVEVPPSTVAIAGTRIPVVRTYESVRMGELLAYVGSANTIEIAVRDGRADTKLGVTRGAIVALDPKGVFR